MRARESKFEGVDRSDPKKLLEILEDALDRFLAGEMVVTAQFADESVTWQAAEVPMLRARINELRRRCAAQEAGRRVTTVYITSKKGT